MDYYSIAVNMIMIRQLLATGIVTATSVILPFPGIRKEPHGLSSSSGIHLGYLVLIRFRTFMLYLTRSEFDICPSFSELRVAFAPHAGKQAKPKIAL